jgi:hypothetical protein
LLGDVHPAAAATVSTVLQPEPRPVARPVSEQAVLSQQRASGRAS